LPLSYNHSVGEFWIALRCCALPRCAANIAAAAAGIQQNSRLETINAERVR
jgi:hypothetical protein